MQLTGSPGFALVGALLVFSASVARGGDEDEEQPGLEVRLVNDEKTHTASFTAVGTTKALPDGTQLTVSFGALSKTRNLICKITRAVVAGNRYRVSEVWQDKSFAPVTYRVRVELSLKKQPPKVRQWIMAEYGYAANHHEIVHHLDKTLGSEQEGAKFQLENLDALDGFVRELREHVEAARAMTAKPAVEQPDWRKQKKAINRKLRRFRSSVDRYFGAYVVMLEQGLRKRIQLAGTDISNLVRAHGRGQPGRDHLLASVREELKTLAALIQERRPAADQQPLIPEDSEEEGS